MTLDDLVEDIFDKEGVKYGDKTTKPPIDQPTGAGGITLGTMSAYLGRPATIGDLKALTRATAAPVVRWKLERIVIENDFADIDFEPLRLQMIDFAYNSGAQRAVRWLQRTLGMSVDGIFGPDTAAAVNRENGRLLNQAMIAARLQMIDEWTDKDQQAKLWEEGVESRGLKFSLI